VSRRGAPIRGALAIVAALVLAACSGNAAPSTDPLLGWSAQPIAVDDALAAKAIAMPACRGSLGDGPVLDVVLQDQRTPSTAAFLLTSGAFEGNCLVEAGGNAIGEGHTAAVPPRAGALAVDERTTTALAGKTVTLLGGRLSPDVVGVRIRLSDGRTLQASTGASHWLAWWPSDASVIGVDALNKAGNVIATITDTTPYWQVK
jgi:hypothetical protein